MVQKAAVCVGFFPVDDLLFHPICPNHDHRQAEGFPQSAISSTSVRALDSGVPQKWPSLRVPHDQQRLTQEALVFGTQSVGAVELRHINDLLLARNHLKEKEKPAKPKLPQGGNRKPEEIRDLVIQIRKETG